MPEEIRNVRRAGVLGAGVMGAQIAAHLANAGVPVLLYDLPSDGDDPSAVARKAVSGLGRLKPPPLADSCAVGLIRPCNYAQDLAELEKCELVIEAVVERLDIKRDLYDRIEPHLGERAILASNTSSLGIAVLAEALSPERRGRFAGVHFFNPPRYMHLLELIAQPAVRPGVMDLLEGFLTTVLGKGVIRVADTPGFIANRIGVFSLLSAMHHAARLELPPDLVDRLTGVGIGHPKSATFRTADVVGLDVLAHVVESLSEYLPDDPWNPHYRVPDWIRGLIERGALGQKTRAGVYRKSRQGIEVFDPVQGGYRPVQAGLDGEVREILWERDPEKKFQALVVCGHPQAQFLLSIFYDLFQYSACWLEEIAPSARDLDLAMRWGYGWTLGPLEAWQAVGWQVVLDPLQEAIAAGHTLAATPLPGWATDPQRQGVTFAEGSWSPGRGTLIPRSLHPVYRRQVLPDRVLGEPEPASRTVRETEATRLWHREEESDIAVLSFKTKMHSIDEAVLDDLIEATAIVEHDFEALVLWHPDQPFSAGANLKMLLETARAGRFDEIRTIVEKFQQAGQALRYAHVPTVAAPRGLVLGGGCELMMHCDRTVAALESYVGLVEVGVGVIPAGGGSKEMARRAAERADVGDPFPFLARYFERIGMGKMAGSGAEARQWDYLRAADPVVLHPMELLHVACHQARALYESGYRPPARRPIKVAGADGAATLEANLVNLHEGHFISDHELRVGIALAQVMCGGDLPPGSEVEEGWLLRLEVDAFMELLRTEATQDRIEHMLKTGKPLRN